jgi:hypothetical protein
VAHSEPGIPLVPCPVCGPVVVVTRRHPAGGTRQRRAEPTGRTGTAAERVPRVDHDLLAELAADIGPLLHASDGAAARSRRASRAGLEGDRVRPVGVLRCGLRARAR